MISSLLHGFQYLSTVKTHRCKNEKYTTDCQKWTSQKLGGVNQMYKQFKYTVDISPNPPSNDLIAVLTSYLTLSLLITFLYI